MSLEFPDVLYTNVKVLVSVVNKLTPGFAQTRPYELPQDREARIAAALEAVDVVGDRYSVDSLKTAESEALYELAADLRTVIASGDDWEAGKRINELLVKYQAAPVLLDDDGSRWRLHFHSPVAGVAAKRGAGTATALAVLLETEQFHRLGVCAASACDRVYFDSSRNGSKRFCSVACTDRTRVALFRERRSLAATRSET